MSSRYSRQERFSPIGIAGQEKLRDAHVLIIGAGALGSSSAEMLARAGVGKITIVDRDYVEMSNLQRQQLYSEIDVINKNPKAVAAQKRLEAINSDIRVQGIVADVNGMNVEDLVIGKALIVDAGDNFETRLIINDAAVKHNVPFLFGACVGSYGITFPMIPGETPCLHCLMDHLPAQNLTCDTAGVISPIVQLVASYQVTTALKFLTGAKLSPLLQSVDIWNDENAKIRVDRLKKENCKTCGNNPSFPYLSFEGQTKTEILCGRNTVQIRPGVARILSFEELGRRLESLGCEMTVNSYLLSCSFEGRRVVLFKDGRALIHGTNDITEARGIYNRLIG
ncbi:ThiF family adenylyltransferase [Mesobacillus foraminis]|uniref:Adenylyltransferase/sulfurtransferase n=1 Tax=Mesobacillus foraminis TaxID=279826 RepID=A0A4R2BLN7_9BACI|nr:ThiF family adenylyltransferase [Mesobacillus foraminis]TCN27159.1 adenylyltransferase/sulfurtransferase [Mesobacillus foraminis]